MSEVINELHTSCRHCVFSKWEDKTQVGCDAGQLEKFKTSGVQVLEVFDDDNKEFFVINDRLCKMSRSPKWKDRQKNQDIISLLEVAREEIKFKYHAIIFFTNIYNLDITITNLTRQTVVPKEITVVRPFSSKILPSIIKDTIMKDVKIKWNIKSLVDSDDYYEGVDMAIRGTQIPYYAIIRDGLDFDNDVFEKIQQKINDDLFQFGMIKGDENDHLTIVNFPFHYLMRGNKGIKLEDKFKEENITCPKISELL